MSSNGYSSWFHELRFGRDGRKPQILGRDRFAKLPKLALPPSRRFKPVQFEGCRFSISAERGALFALPPFRSILTRTSRPLFQGTDSSSLPTFQKPYLRLGSHTKTGIPSGQFGCKALKLMT